MLKFCLNLLFCLALQFTCLSQTPEKALENIRNNYTTENIFIHFDKAAYVSGETIWFKAYVMAGGVPSAYSSSINVSLLNDSGRIIQTKILPLINSAAVGDFTLDKDLKQANYTVLAYTKRLLNFGSTFFYNQPVPVFNPTSGAETRTAAVVENLFFMPEGGNIIGGINNNIAFKSFDKFGYPVPVAGEVVDSKGEVVAEFESTHDGMGKFQMIAKADEKYIANIVFDKTRKQKVALPVVKVSGTAMQVLQGDKKIHLLVNREKVGSEQEAPSFVLGIINNEVVFKSDLPATPNVRLLIPSDKLPSGVMQLTVFTKDNKPLCERLLFINNQDFSAKGNFVKETVSLKPRGKNQLSFSLTDTVAGTFSVSVTDMDRELGKEKMENIVARNLLTGHMKGFIYEPGYYFKDNEAKTKSNLDLVMLTHGWRKYNWDQVLNNRLPALSYKDEDYITVKGSVYDGTTNALLKNTMLTGFINFKDSTNEFVSVPVDSAGNFILSGLLFQDTAQFFYQNADKKKKSALLKLTSYGLRYGYSYVPASLVGIVKPLSVITPEVTEQAKAIYSSVYANDDKSLLLKNVVLATVRTKSKEKVMEDKYVTNKIFSGGHTTLDFINDPPKTNLSQNVFEYLKGRLSSVNISGSMGNYFLNFRGARTLVTGPIPMVIFLDEQEVTSQQASTVRIGEVAMIKVLGTGFVGVSGSGGALAIYMKKGVDNNLPANSALKPLKIEGYSPTKEFFSPDYAIAANNIADTDNRSTIYWNPYLEANAENKKLLIPFYNSDKARRLRVILAGFTAEGRLLHIESIIE